MRTYSVLVPSGYLLVDLSVPYDEVVTDVARRVVAGLTSDARAKAKKLVKKTLQDTFRKMVSEDAFAVMISTAPLAEQAIRPMLVFSLYRPADTNVAPLDALVAMAATEEGSTLLEVGSMVGLRVAKAQDVSVRAQDLPRRLPSEVVALGQGDPESLRRMEMLAGARVSRRVEYFLGAPDDDDSWLRVQAGVQVADDVAGAVIADTLAQLFDAIVGTFRWVDHG